MQFTFQRTNTRPLYHQLADQIREYIRSGALSAGARLPTIRYLSSEYGLTRLTVHSAYMQLHSEGLIEASVGRGTFVATQPSIPISILPTSSVRVQTPQWLSQGVLADMMRMTEYPDLISFAQVAPAIEAYPIHELSKSVRLALDDPAALGYGPTQGDLRLREQLAHLLLDRSIVTSPDSILITAGAQQGIDLALRVFAPSADTIVLTEEPTYVGLIELAAQRQQRLAGIPIDEQGIQLEPLEAACKLYHPRLLYLIPSFHNPTGLSLSPERREAILKLADKYDFFILEDDIYGMLTYEQLAPPALKSLDTNARVIYLLSFSKLLMPSLRLCAMVSPAQYLQPLLTVKRCSDLTCSPLLQYALADYLQRNHLQAHLQRSKLLYKERRDAMFAALERFLPDCSWTHPAGGLCLWVTLPAQINERDFYLAAIQRGVGIAPGSAFVVAPPSVPAMRLSFCNQPPKRIFEGIGILGDLLREQLAQHTRLAARAGYTTYPLL